MFALAAVPMFALAAEPKLALAAASMFALAAEPKLDLAAASMFALVAAQTSLAGTPRAHALVPAGRPRLEHRKTGRSCRASTIAPKKATERTRR